MIQVGVAERPRMRVTSPPYYGLRNYGNEEKQIGQEQTPEEYIQNLVNVFREVRDVLADDGTCWLNIGDSYYNYRPEGDKDWSNRQSQISKQDLPDVCARRGNRLDGLKEKRFNRYTMDARIRIESRRMVFKTGYNMAQL